MKKNRTNNSPPTNSTPHTHFLGMERDFNIKILWFLSTPHSHILPNKVPAEVKPSLIAEEGFIEQIIIKISQQPLTELHSTEVLGELFIIC